MVVLLLAIPAHGAVQAPISESFITRLKSDLAALETIESTTERRMACKRIVRRAESLVEKSPESDERFTVLGVVFEAQKVMFTMRQSAEYHEALMATADKLVGAPDEYADIRLGADVLVQQSKLSADSSPIDQAITIAELADRYRGTSAEAESLMVASMVSFDLGNRALLEAFRKALSTRFGDDPRVTVFMRERFAAGSEINLRGQFERSDGKRISLPIGQTYVVCFWSLDAPLLKDKIAQITALQERNKGQFKVFSFNLDELPDGGSSALKRMKLDWIPMLLPGGIDSPTWRSTGGVNLFSAHVVSPYGLARMNSTRQRPAALQTQHRAAFETPRRLALLRSLCIGDFLILGPPGTRDSVTVPGKRIPGRTSVSPETVREIRSCFPAPPTRYRLTPEEEQKNYEKAERLCGEVVAKHPDAPDMWIFHNHRTIALLGMWRLSGELDYLDRAVVSAKAALAMNLPPVARAVPQFCLATHALMDDDADVAEILSQLVNNTDKRAGAGHAAALMLAVEAHSRDQYVKYRDILLKDYIEDASVWPVTSLLLDRSASSRSFEKALPGTSADTVEGHGPRRMFRSNWTTSDGKQASIPANTNGIVNAVVFIELTGDRNAVALQKRVVDHLVGAIARRPRKDLKLTGVFRSGDTNKVAALMKQNKWAFEAVCLAEPEWQRPARELGIFAADLRPNVFLVHPDGSIMLALTGVSSDTERPETLTKRIDEVLVDRDLVLAGKALAAKDYAEYAARLETSFPLKTRRRSRHEPEWKAPNAHRRNLVWAYMQAKDWKKALSHANAAIVSHESYARSRKSSCGSCATHLVPLFHRVQVFKDMGKVKEAAEALALADAGRCPAGSANAPRSNFPGRRLEGRNLNDRLAYLEKYVRFGPYEGGINRQPHFELAADLLTRAEVLDQLGQGGQAAADRKRAEAMAWPYPVPRHDPAQSAGAGKARRELAREHISREEWQAAADCVSISISAHEAWLSKAGRHCHVCAMQIVPLQIRLSVLLGSGRKAEAAATAAMIEVATCPPDSTERATSSFPRRYYPRGKAAALRHTYIEDYMRRTTGKEYVKERFDMAADLSLRAEALEKLGKEDEAARDRLRAKALLWPIDAKTASSIDAMPMRYVDIVDIHRDESGAGAELVNPVVLPEKDALKKASVGGKYANLLRTITVKSDLVDGLFQDYGFWDSETYAGNKDLPEGYWVYVYPKWYIFEKRGEGR
jgi:tetratricopeptide (TPR) repeat protein